METASGTTESLVKLIRNDSIGIYVWDENDVNDWSTSSLQESLNNSYLQGSTLGSGKGITEATREMIEEVIWKLGGTISEYATAAEFYSAERGTTVYSGHATEWRGKVGLMYASDYGYATSGGSGVDRATCLATELDNNWEFTDCYRNDWLFTSDDWTLTPHSSNLYNVFYVIYAGFVDNDGASELYGFRPSVYLKSNITISSGDGTSSSPYTLS